jgi:hypothetical protein
MENEDILMRNQQLILENEALRLHIEDLKNGFEGSCMACEPVGEMNKKLRAERDEARRDHLGLLKEVKDLTERHAHMSNIALGARADVHQTRRDLDRANKERDEARRLACFLRAEIESSEPMIHCRKVAEEYKWDCFKEDGK